MKALTIRNVDRALSQALERERRAQGTSLNETVLRLLRRALALEPEGHENGLAKLAGTWSQEDFDEFREHTRAFDQIDDELWS